MQDKYPLSCVQHRPSIRMRHPGPCSQSRERSYLVQVGGARGSIARRRPAPWRHTAGNPDGATISFTPRLSYTAVVSRPMIDRDRINCGCAFCDLNGRSPTGFREG